MTWRQATLSDVCKVLRGTTITQAQACPGNIPVIAGGTGPTYFHDTPNRPGGTITVSASGANAGYVNFWDRPIFASDCSTVEGDGDAVDIRFMYHQLRAKQRLINGLRTGAAQPHVYARDLAQLVVAVPPIAEQRRIAVILDKADALRTKRSEALSQLDRLAQSVFAEMFGDPVTGPKNCSHMKLADCVASMEYGPRFYEESYSDEGIRIVRITDLDQSGALNFDAMPRMNLDTETIKRHALLPGDIVFARTGATVGKVALIQELDPPCIAGAYFIRLKFGDSVLPIYALSVLRTRSVQALIAKQSRQAAQQNFSGPGLRSLPMPVPPMPAQKAFARLVESVLEEKKKLIASLTETGLLFSSLQYRAFQGTL